MQNDTNYRADGLKGSVPDISQSLSAVEAATKRGYAVAWDRAKACLSSDETVTAQFEERADTAWEAASLMFADALTGDRDFTLTNGQRVDLTVALSITKLVGSILEEFRDYFESEIVDPLTYRSVNIC